MKRFVVLLVILSGVSFILSPPLYADIRFEKGTYYISDAEGHAQMTDGNKKSAREEAKKIAMRDAVIKASAEFAPGIIETEKYKSVLEKILKSGIVKNFKINSERAEGDTLFINASCRISRQSLDNALGPQVIAMLGNPRVMIVVDERVGGKAPFISTVETELNRVFQKAGYLIVDKEQAESLLALDPQKSFSDPSLLTAAAKKLRADIIIVARATGGASSHTKLYGINMYKTSGQVQIKAVLTQTAYQISSATISGGSGKNWVGSPTSGIGGIFKNGVERAASEIIYAIAYNMASAGSSPEGITVNVKIAGATFDDVEQIEAKLSEIAGSNGNVFERSYSDKLLEVDVVSPKTARNIASLLSDYVDINGYTTQTLTGRVKGPVKRDDDDPVKPGVTINIYIDRVDKVDDEEYTKKLTSSLREFVGTQGSINISHENTTLSIKITYPSNVTVIKDSGAVASFLADNNIKIDTVKNDSIKGWKRGGWLW